MGADTKVSSPDAGGPLTLHSIIGIWDIERDANDRKLPLFLQDYTLDCPDAKSVNAVIIWNPCTLRGHVYARGSSYPYRNRLTFYIILRLDNIFGPT